MHDIGLVPQSLNEPRITREELRANIDLMEAMEDVLSAIDDLLGMELEPGEADLINVQFNERSELKRQVAFLHALPRDVAIVGLRAMQRALEAKLVRQA